MRHFSYANPVMPFAAVNATKLALDAGLQQAVAIGPFDSRRVTTKVLYAIVAFFFISQAHYLHFQNHLLRRLNFKIFEF